MEGVQAWAQPARGGEGVGRPGGPVGVGRGLGGPVVGGAC